MYKKKILKNKLEVITSQMPHMESIAIGIWIAGVVQLFAQQDIAAARIMGPGATVTVSGIVTSGSELGIIRYMQDLSGGLALYSSQMSDVRRGDSVTVTG